MLSNEMHFNQLNIGCMQFIMLITISNYFALANKIGKEGILAVVEPLRANKLLHYLELSGTY